METVGEERLRAAQSLKQLEEAALLLAEASKSLKTEKISPGFPKRVSAILNSLTAISSREDAERLLATGVAMWNGVIAFEGSNLEENMKEALVQLRHVAADCMYMATTVLGGISARYNIDGLSLLKFYTACGQKYSTDLGDMDMADVCFSKGAEFVEQALNDSRAEVCKRKTFARAMFDLLLGRAECSWEKDESDEAERYVSDARQYMDDLPGEHEFLASVEYNFGLFTYQAKETQRALKWLKKSMETRGNPANTMKNVKKQAKTARLAGVCLLALQDYEGSWNLMNEAEEICHDPVGSYLLLKLSVIIKKPQALDILTKTVQDPDNSLDICIASISLFGDAQRISDAAVGFENLFERFRDSPRAIAGTIGMRYFETLAALGKIEKALEILEASCAALTQLKVADAEEPKDVHDDVPHEEHSVDVLSARWSAMLLAVGSSQADRKDFYSAALLLNRCLQLAKTALKTSEEHLVLIGKSDSDASNVVVENEAAVCRLASSCALCAIDDMKKKSNSMWPTDSKENGTDGTPESAFATLLEMSRSNAERAKHLDSSDFAPRLLLFRAHLVANEHKKAAVELRNASADIRSFDPGALAEAACAARDVGSQESVVAALRCILNMDTASLSKNLGASSATFPKGFYGKVLLSCVHILLDRKVLSWTEEDDVLESGSETARDECIEKQETDLLSVLKAGLIGIQHLGPTQSFDDDKGKIHEGLTYLINVSWNKGREQGTKMNFLLWEGFFDICYQLSAFLPPDAAILQTRRMSMLMCASANIENPKSSKEDFQKARKQVQEARRLSEALQKVAPTKSEDPIEGLLLILDSRCCVGGHDADALACVVESALQKMQVEAGVLEQLAAVCHNFKDASGGLQDNAGEIRVRCADLVAALLAKACDVRLCDEAGDLGALAVTLREHLGVEISRGSTAARAHAVFSRAVGVVLEHKDEFPLDERRWLVAISWDRAQMFHRLGQNAEANRWCQGARQLAEGCVALSSYMPRLDSLLNKLNSLVHK